MHQNVHMGTFGSSSQCDVGITSATVYSSPGKTGGV